MKKTITRFIAIVLSTGMLAMQGFSFPMNVRAEELPPEAAVFDLEPGQGDADTNTDDSEALSDDKNADYNGNDSENSREPEKNDESPEEKTENNESEYETIDSNTIEIIEEPEAELTVEELFSAGRDAFISDLQDRIDKLPATDGISKMTSADKQALADELDVICNIYYDDLTEEEQEQITGFEAIGELFEALGAYGTALLAGTSDFGDFSVTGDDLSGVKYTPANGTYKLYGWDVGEFRSNGVLEITKSGTYSIKMKSGKSQTTDRIKIKSGTKVNLTIEGLNIAPNKTDGSAAHYGEGRPFDMKGAEVKLTLKGNNTFHAPSFNTALFCPGGSTLTIDGSGTLKIYNDSKDLCVAGIGGEGKAESKYTYEKMKGANIVSGHENLAKVREWPNDDDSRCGDITINGSPNIIVELKIGDWDPVYGYEPEAELVDFFGDGDRDSFKNCLLKTPSFKYTDKYNGQERENSIDLGQTYYLSSNQIVGIGGAYAGNITINGGTIDVKTSVLSVGIGSVNREFGKLKITNGKVSAKTCWKSIRPISFTDYVGSASSLGPAIGWVKYGDSQPSNMVIEITGGTVNATSEYGAAGIGGGVDSTGGTIIISGGNVTAQGGFNGAGIGSGIGQSITGNKTGEGKIIITGGTVKAIGGTNAAGIGGGGNPLGADKTGGQSGTIIIAGNASVTANGGQNAPGIGAGGSQSQNNYNANAAKVQAIIITTTGNVVANGGDNAPTNIGAAKLGNDTTTTQRYAGSVIVNTSNAQISNTANMPNLAAKDANGNIDVKGSVDLTAYDFVSQYTSTPNADIVSKAVVDYLKNNSSKNITGGSDSSLKISQTQQSQLNPSQVTGSVNVSGVQVTKYTISVQASTGGSVSISGFSGNSATVAKGTTVTIKATPGNGYAFDKWSDGNTSAERTVTVNSAVTLTASFKTASSGGGGSTTGGGGGSTTGGGGGSTSGGGGGSTSGGGGGSTTGGGGGSTSGGGGSTSGGGSGSTTGGGGGSTSGSGDGSTTGGGSGSTSGSGSVTPGDEGGSGGSGDGDTEGGAGTEADSPAAGEGENTDNPDNTDEGNGTGNPSDDLKPATTVSKKKSTTVTSGSSVKSLFTSLANSKKMTVSSYKVTGSKSVTVSSKGVIQLKGNEGKEIKVKVSAYDKKKKLIGTKTITVKKPVISKITGLYPGVKNVRATDYLKASRDLGFPTWSSAQKTVAKIDKKTGVITPVNPGTTKLTANFNGYKVTYTLTVNAPKLSKTKASVKAGKSVNLKVNYLPSGTKVTWKTSDKKIATVKNGKVTGVKKGTATITAVINKKSYNCKITVTK